MSAPLPPNETARLAALRATGLLDSPAEQAFDDLTKIAAAVCGTPIALVSLIDSDRQWFKSRVGLEAPETPRDMAFCAHAILGGDLFEVPDAAADPRFRFNPLVVNEPNIRFYAGYPLEGTDGHRLGTLCVIDRLPKNLTAPQREALAALGRQLKLLLTYRENEEKYKGVIERLAEGVYLVDNRTEKIVEANGPLLAMLGYARDELIGLKPADLFTGESEETVWATAEAAREAIARHGRCDLGRRTYRRKDGSIVNVAVQVGRVPHGDVGMTSVIVRDITDQTRSEDRLEESRRQLEAANAALRALATTDALTGARNRAAFDDTLAREIARGRRYGRPLSLLLLDVDHFKTFNDTFGHPAGDDVLRLVAQALGGAVRATDLLARYGGEEFAVVLPDTDPAGAAVIAERCRRTIAELPWAKRAITVSVGAATLGRRHETPVAFIEDADVALYRSKRQGRNQVHHADGPIAVADGPIVASAVR